MTTAAPITLDLLAAKLDELARAVRAPAVPRMLTVDEVAKAARVGPGTVRGWITTGALKATPLTIGKGRTVYRIAPDHFAAFLDRAANPATPTGTPTRTLRVRRGLV